MSFRLIVADDLRAWHQTIPVLPTTFFLALALLPAIALYAPTEEPAARPPAKDEARLLRFPVHPPLHLKPVNAHVAGRVGRQPHGVAPDLRHGDGHGPPDHDRFPDSPAQYQHRGVPRLGVSRPW